MNTNTEFSSDYVLDKKVEEILNIEKNLINIFGVKFPTSVDEKGSFAQIKGIKLDASTSSKLTYQMWSLNFLYRTLHKSNDQFGTFELRKKVTEVLTKVLKKLKKSNALEDIIGLLNTLEKEQQFLKDGIIDDNFVVKAS